MVQYEQPSLFNLTPYIVSWPAMDNVRMIVKASSQKESHVKLEMELLIRIVGKSDDNFRLAA